MPTSPDVVVVGAGPCGAVAAATLAGRGLSVVVVEAGPALDALPNAESNAAKILWTGPRTFAGPDGVVPKMGTGVGGGSLAWLGVVPRFQRHDFRTKSLEGYGDDWPITYDDLRPYYERIERDFGVAGECGPCAVEPYDLPMPPHRMNWHAELLARGAKARGARPFAPPVAINSVPYKGRPACVYCGWCGSGCPTGAKATSQNTFLNGTPIIPDATVHRVTHDRSRNRVTGVLYRDKAGKEHRIAAKAVVLAAHAVESPRLLLLSGLANSSGTVGTGFMSHATWQVFGTFADPVHAYKGMQMGHVMVQDFLGTDPRRNCVRGFVLISYMTTPITYANLSGLSHGPALKDFLYEYAHTAAWWAHAEGERSVSNRVTLDPDLKDGFGEPAARVTYAWTSNDKTLVAAARDTAADFMAASGAAKVRAGLQYAAHAMGSCRMGDDPLTSVVTGYGQSHDVPNLFVLDTSTFVTSAGVNPTLTGMAVAARGTEYLAEAARKGDL
jgi:choline dehydrogenase-like flavoprotein